MLKKVVKSSLHYLLPKKNGYSKLKVRGGPVKGAIFEFDLRAEGSYWLGNYDQWIFNAVPFEKYIKPGDVCWDCGAYIGYYTAFFRKLVGEKGRVHTFEASKANYNRVKRLPKINQWTNVFVHNLAVGPDHSEVEFVDNLGGASGPFGLSKKYLGSRSELRINKVVSCGVDELVYEKNISAPDFIKFDLESAEEFALHNGDQLFATKRPIVLLELHGEKAKKAAGLFFEKYNYEGLIISDMSLKIHSADEFDKISGVPHMLLCLPQ